MISCYSKKLNILGGLVKDRGRIGHQFPRPCYCSTDAPAAALEGL